MDQPILTPAQLQALPDQELRLLQGELPPIISDAQDARNAYRDRIIAECKRRGFWQG